MCRCALPPAFVLDDIICATFPCVAERFESIATDRAEARGAATCSHVHWISRMTEVKASGILPERGYVSRDGKAEASCG